MAQMIDFNGLLHLARDLLARPDRQVLAIAGAPGSGKSTLVARLVAALENEAVAILPMDGFHYDDGVLESMGRRPWKGAPDTFDVGGLRSTLARLRDPDEGGVAVPVFDRTLEISRGSARIIGPEVRLVLAEGNYLLLDRQPWRSLRRHFDATVLMDAPEQTLKQRLRQRWEGYGLSEAQIDFKLEQNDLPNGRLVVASTSGMDFVLR